MACEHPITGHAARFEDGNWHYGFDIDDDRAYCATGPDLFEIVHHVEEWKEEYIIGEVMRS